MNQQISEKYLKLLLEEGLGLDLSDPHLKGTPKRIAKMYHKEFFQNMTNEFDGYMLVHNSDNYNQIICSGKIEAVSTCAHHFLPFKFTAWLLYIPDRYIVGASKPARLIEHYSKRPQTQEQLCHQIIKNFDEKVEPKGTMIFINGTHDCMQCRGVNQKHSDFSTSAISGAFTNPELELKGYEIIKISMGSN